MNEIEKAVDEWIKERVFYKDHSSQFLIDKLNKVAIPKSVLRERIKELKREMTQYKETEIRNQFYARINELKKLLDSEEAGK